MQHRNVRRLVPFLIAFVAIFATVSFTGVTRSGASIPIDAAVSTPTSSARTPKTTVPQKSKPKSTTTIPTTTTVIVQAKTVYVKVPFSPRVYKQTGNQLATYVTHAAYVKAGRPAVTTVDRMNGDSMYRFVDTTPVYYLFPDGMRIHMTPAQRQTISERKTSMVDPNGTPTTPTTR